jgi:hypothetical protein
MDPLIGAAAPPPPGLTGSSLTFFLPMAKGMSAVLARTRGCAAEAATPFFAEIVSTRAVRAPVARTLQQARRRFKGLLGPSKDANKHPEQQAAN